MKNIFTLFLILFSGYAFPDAKLSGIWNCKMTLEEAPDGMQATSLLTIRIQAAEYERNGDFKYYFKELGGFNIHKTTYEKGSIRFEKGSLTFSPLEVDSKVLESGPLPKSTFSDDNESLLADETAKITKISSDSFTAEYPNGSVESCKKRS